MFLVESWETPLGTPTAHAPKVRDKIDVGEETVFPTSACFLHTGNKATAVQCVGGGEGGQRQDQDPEQSSSLSGSGGGSGV